MSSVDQRVVEMKFDNKAFENGVKSTLDSLSSLKNGLKLTGATKGLTDIDAAGKKISFGSVTDAASEVGRSFSAMSVIAVTALATITKKIIDTGASLAKSLTVTPITAGLKEYETNLNSIQTIMANTGLEGKKGLGEVNKALSDLNHYSDLTIYNFSQMARNIGTFTAAGVKLDVATGAIKGIANLAAVSGSSADQASTAMYQLSQALASGKVKLMDWNSVVNAGMGGKVFQEALKETARNHNVAVDSIIKKEGGFRDSLQTGWLSSSILTETLSKFTGDMTAAQLKQLGYTDQQIVGIQKMGKTAQDAATKVKTMSQLIGTLQEAAGSGWTQTWQLVFGDFDQAKELFTGVNNVLSGMINASAAARNKVLGDWNKLGGRTVLIDAISNAFHALIAVLKPIKDAFREIFPAKTGKDLYDFTVTLRDFTEKLKIGATTATNLKDTFAGVFAIFSIIGKVISGVASMFGVLFGSIASGSGGFLTFTGGIGKTLVSFNEMLGKSGAIKNFFQDIGKFLAIPLKLLSAFGSVLAKLFSGFDGAQADKVSLALGRVTDKLSPIEAMAKKVHTIFSALGTMLGKVGHAIGSAIGGIGSAIAKAITPETFSKSLDVINTGLIAGIFLLFKKFFSGGGLKVEVGGGISNAIKTSLGAVTDTMKSMQAQIKADIILKIAGALALLTASIVVLSTIDGKKLAKGLLGVTIGFAGLQVALVKMSSAISLLGAAKLPFIAIGIVGLATAMLLLSAAVKVMASLEFGDMMRGLTGLAGALFIIQKAMKAMPASMALQGAGLVLVGVGLNAIAAAVKIFGTISWEAMLHGLAAMAGALVIIAGAIKLMPASMALQAAGLVIIGVGLTGIAAALKVFATISWKEMAQGLAAMAGALLIIAGAIALMPPTMALQAVGLVAVGLALNIIAGAVILMSTMSWEAIGKGLVTLAGALVILAGGLYLMTGTLLGAAALVVAAAALVILTPVLITLGTLSWQTIVTGLAALAGIFVVLGVAGLVLAPIVPVIIGLAAAMVLIGAGLALAGLGAVSFATAFGIVVATGSAGVQVLADILTTLVASIPLALKAFGEGIVAFALAIAKGGSAFFAAFSAILTAVLNSIITNAPKIGAAFLAILSTLLNIVIVAAPKLGQAFLVLLNTALNVLIVAIPRMTDAGLKILTGFLNGVANNIDKVVTAAVSVIVAFINAIAKNLSRIIQAGVTLLLSFIDGVTKAIDDNAEKLGEAAGRLGVAIVKGMVKGIAGGVGAVASAAKDLAKSALGAAGNFLGINSPSKEFMKIGMGVDEGFALGMDKFSHLVTKSAESVGQDSMTALQKSLTELSTIGTGNLDIRPVITPVLDLSKVQTEAGRIGSMIQTSPISVGTAYSKAKDASAGYQANQTATIDVAALTDTSKKIEFNQYNTSPKALTSAEIYRQTNNQLSQMKGALTR